LANSTRGLGRVSVRGLRRVPKPIGKYTNEYHATELYCHSFFLPPTRIRAFIYKDCKLQRRRRKMQRTGKKKEKERVIYIY
jgi:hypothetical protein